MQLTTSNHAMSGDVLGPDPLTSAAHEIENLSEARAHAMVAEIADARDFDAFRLGGVLARIHREKWFAGAGYADFRSYVEGRHGFRLRKAHYLVSIYGSVIDLGLTWAELKPVGWSKLKELVGVITKDNASEWLATAAADGMTVLKLHGLVQDAKGERQALLERSTGPVVREYDDDTDDARPRRDITDAQFKAHMAAIGWEATLAVFEQNFPDLALTVEES